MLRIVTLLACLLVSPMAGAWTDRVVHLVDGDTLTVLHDGWPDSNC